MNNGQLTKAFFTYIQHSTKYAILNNIACHYGINTDEAYSEITSDDAEYLLDYLTGEQRSVVSLLMQKYINTIARAKLSI